MPTATARMVAASAAPPALLTIHEAAEYLRVSTRTLYSLTRPRGPIPCIRVGPRGVRFSLASLQRFIRDQESGNQQT